MAAGGGPRRAGGSGSGGEARCSCQAWCPAPFLAVGALVREPR